MIVAKENINWQIGVTPLILENIQEEVLNISIYDRDISHMKREIKELLQQEINLKINGDIYSILNQLNVAINQNQYGHIINDIKELIEHFKRISNSNNFRLTLAAIDNNMCRRFHTDMNDLRMICTYSGPGTLWLTENNTNRMPLNNTGNNDSIVINENKIKQLSTGSVAILKGALYLGERTKAAVHRSPNIEESKQVRLFLRIDTNDFLNFQI